MSDTEVRRPLPRAVDTPRRGKTGSEGQPWMELEKPKPAKVDDETRYWQYPPPELSPRCQYWSRQIERGWLPNRSVSRLGYDPSAGWFGVYIWEYLNVLYPLIEERRRALGGTAA